MSNSKESDGRAGNQSKSSSHPSDSSKSNGLGDDSSIDNLNDDLIDDERIGSIPLRRQQILRWNGWGYKDSGFFFDRQTSVTKFMGDRYKIGGKTLPNFKPWAEKELAIDFSGEIFSGLPFDETKLPKSILNRPFLEALHRSGIKFSLNGEDRLYRSHGHCLHEIFSIRLIGTIPRIPDIVVFPKSHDEVVTIVSLANEHKVVIIPFGGGTSVSGGLECPPEETRMIVSLDTSRMNKILWIDPENMIAHAEAGIIGQDLERELGKHGLCTGHEPDSFEFSSLGGWVATRASGMKKNIYGNIEDIIVLVKMVTPIGVVEKNCRVPRMSSGPDIHHFILGSEGTLGVITEVSLRVRSLPVCKKYNSIIFHDFENGFRFMREVARKKLKPASIRLLDNKQFAFGLSLKPEVESYWEHIQSYFKKIYVTKLKGFQPDNMCLVTMLMEGETKEVEVLESQLIDLAIKHNGLIAGEENGKQGYLLTFVIAYLRDLGLDYGIVAESFETSVPWDRCLQLCNNVKECITQQVKKHKIPIPPLITWRLTQMYDTGACIYFYFAYNYRGVDKDPVETYLAIENAAREEIIACGGSISHHHGVGKIRKQWLKDTISGASMGALRAVKSYLDPNNIFANGNLLTSKL